MGIHVNRGRVIRPRDSEPLSRAKSSKAPQPGETLTLLNTGTLKQLQGIKGVGKATANDIISERKADGEFASLEDCAERVGGVSLDMLDPD